MKVALATIIKGDTYDQWFLDHVFPSFVGLFDGWLIQRAGVNPDFAEAKNKLIRQAEADGFDWIFFMDADEAMFLTDILHIFYYINEELDDLIVQPRLNFVSDDHIEMKTYPDLQGRVFKLNVGYHYRGHVHETVFREKESVNWYTKNSGLRVLDCPIYHYGWCKPPEELAKKSWREGEVVDSHLYPGVHPLKGKHVYS